MHSHHHRHCHESTGSSGSSGPAMCYGYCHDTGQMRMMTYPDYMSSMQKTYTNMYSNSAAMAQQLMDMMMGRTSGMMPMGGTMPAGGMMQGRYGRERGHEHCGCGCQEHHDCGCHEHDDCDCACHCHVRCADTVEYARCGEVRQIPITFENETRRERNVTLGLSSFATESGTDVGWKATLSETTFTLPACGHKTVMLTVPVQCGGGGQTGGDQNPTGGQNPPGTTAGTTDGPPVRGPVLRGGQVDTCKVAYASLSAEGCRVRPLVIAVAVLPNHCGSYRADCGCGCC